MNFDADNDSDSATDLSNLERDSSLEERILDAGLAEFVENGYGSTREDAIAHAAGVSVGELREHFGTKEALFCLVADRESTRTRHSYANGIPKFDSAIDALRFAAKSHVNAVFTTAMPELVRIAIVERDRFPNLMSIFCSNNGENLMMVFAEHVLQDFIQQGLFKKSCNTSFVAAQFTGMVEHAVLHHRLITGEPIPDLDDYLDSCCQLLADAYGT